MQHNNKFNLSNEVCFEHAVKKWASIINFVCSQCFAYALFSVSRMIYSFIISLNSQLSKRVEIWGEIGRAFNYGIVWGAHMYLFSNSCAPQKIPQYHKNRPWHKMDSKNDKIVPKLAKLPSFRPLALKSEFLLKFEFLKNYKDLYEKCCWWAWSAGEQGLLTSNIFHTNPSNFRKIQAAIKTHSAALGGWNLATFIFLACSFHFWHLLCTTTVFDYWQGHVTVSCKGPIERAHSRPSFPLFLKVGYR